MSRIPTTNRPISQVGGELLSVVQDVEAHGPVELMRDGEPVAVIVSVSDYLPSRPEQRSGLWDAIQQFRAETDLDELDIDSAMEGIRDRSPGREIDL